MSCLSPSSENHGCSLPKILNVCSIMNDVSVVSLRQKISSTCPNFTVNVQVFVISSDSDRAKLSVHFLSDQGIHDQRRYSIRSTEYLPYDLAEFAVSNISKQSDHSHSLKNLTIPNKQKHIVLTLAKLV